MKIKRRIYKGLPVSATKKGKKGTAWTFEKEVIEEVTLIKRCPKSVIVKLANGDIIRRNVKDIIKEK